MTTAPLPSIIASRYVPVRLIAKGGMGAVYEVEHVRTGEHLALKVLLSSVRASPEQLERFKREARASARIKSEHVVRVTDADTAPELEGAPFLVMELLEGADLEREVASGPPPPATVVDWLRQVARALDKAHRLGIVHRDLKPENLFLAKGEDRPPMVKILDFGILKMTEDGTGATDSGQILGTPRYMAPEQASSKQPVTAAADRYALGLVAYRLLTGESYYKGDVMSVLAQLLHQSLELPSKRHPGLGGEFDTWFLKACHRAPAHRFSSAAEQIEALSAALGMPTLALDAVSERTSPKAGARPRGRLIRVVAVAAAAVALVGGVFLYRRFVASDSGATSAEATSPEPAVIPPTEAPAAASVPAAAAVGPPSPRAVPVTAAEFAPPIAAPRLTKPRVPQRRATIAHAADRPPATSVEPPQSTDPYADQR